MALCARYRPMICRMVKQVRHGTRWLSDQSGSGSDEKEYIPPGGVSRSAFTILKEELKPLLSGEITGTEAPVPRRTDVLIIGGGLVGTAAAYFLKNSAEKMYDVTIIERDYAYTRASSMLSAGGLRHQFTIPENVQLSMYTTEFLKHYREHLSVLGIIHSHIKGSVQNYYQDPPDVHFHHQGYLFLAPAHRADFLEECVKMQREQGAKTVMLSRKQLEEKYPWLNLDDIECASFGTYGEGWFDPWQLVHSMKAKNVNLGVRYCEGEVVDFRFEERQRVEGSDFQKLLRGVDIDHKNGKRYGCDASIVINCAGPWAGEIARMAGIGAGDTENNIFKLPVEPRKRYVYSVHCPDGPTLDCPFLVDTSGAYFRREGYGGHYICGASPSEEEEPNISDLSVDYDFYNDYVWPTIAHRVPAFNNSKLKSAWAGYYDYNTVDQNLIVGMHPEYKNFFFANGMSGHGVQQALAIGRATFELIFYGQYKTIDLSRFEFTRFIADNPIREHAIV